MRAQRNAMPCHVIIWSNMGWNGMAWHGMHACHVCCVWYVWNVGYSYCDMHDGLYYVRSVVLYCIVAWHGMACASRSTTGSCATGAKIQTEAPAIPIPRTECCAVPCHSLLEFWFLISCAPKVRVRHGLHTSCYPP